MRMELGQRLEVHLTQQLILQMRLLQVSALDLEQIVRQELEENPAIEESDGSVPSIEAEANVSVPESTAPSDTAPEAPEAAGAAEPSEAQIQVKPGEEYSLRDLLPDDSFIPGATYAGRTGDDDETSGVELAAGAGLSLVDTLLPRLRGTMSEPDALVAEYILESLDEDGFLTMSEEEIAEVQCVDVERVRTLLHVIQRLEPGGIACKDTRTSMLVQLELRGYPPDCLERKLLADHWDLMMKKQTGRIAKLCCVSEDDVRQAVHTLLGLETRPARGFAPSVPDYVSPDFSVEWQDDKLVAVANDETFPRLRLSRWVREVLDSPKSHTPEQVKFAREKFNRALMFLRGIESRKRTLRRVVELIVEQQRDFFVQGRHFLKPATLRQAADVIGVHASTVSRAIAGKYLDTEYGVFPFDYFFKAGAGDKSRTSIKQKIQAIIGSEDKKNPLSDDEICERLKGEGIDISRRTVAKYRAELGTPGCTERKEF